MSSTKHTEEPSLAEDVAAMMNISRYLNDSKAQAIENIANRMLARISASQRAQVCVNACAGLDLPDDVEKGAVADAVAALRHAMNAYDPCVDWSNTDDPIVCECRIARNGVLDALAKLEGK